MSYCKTGPAIGPHGRGHSHKVACCTSCARGGTCESQALSGFGGTAFGVVAMLGAAGFVLYQMTRQAKGR